MADKFKFNDRALDQAVTASASQFQNFQKLLDDTTADIRNLEKYLQQCGLCIPTYVELDSRTQIGWDKHGDSWRLICVIEHEDGLEEKPILDSNAKFRLTCKPHLVLLVNEITKLLPDPVKALDEDLDSIFATDDEMPY